MDEFCISFCNVVEKYCRYIVVSGFVAISSGRARATEDIDMIIDKIPFEKFRILHDDLVKHGFVCIQSDSSKDIFEYLDDNLAVRYTYRNQPLPEMELKFAKDNLDQYQLNSRVKLPLTGLDIWFGSINMNISFKEEFKRSEKDLKDAKHLRTVYPEKVDESEIKKIKSMIKRLRL
ncbi:hypothetical protein GF327_08770 [Candidatus Woesearchaeota archaeon]|nr:hypothetical protein [Candidatus Woesearchaeota archaeon]